MERQVYEDDVHGNRSSRDIAQAVIEFSLENPHLGQVQVANHLREQYEIEISVSGVQENMHTMALRLRKKAEASEVL